MSEEQLAQLEKLANAASQAPWEVLHLHSPNGESQRLYCFDGPTLIDIAHAPMEYVANNANNLPFAAMAREMVPGLIGEVRRLRGVLDAEREKTWRLINAIRDHEKAHLDFWEGDEILAENHSTDADKRLWAMKA